MATDESSFKAEIRKSLDQIFQGKIQRWSNNDKFTYGLPDESVHYEGLYFPIEVKFARVPKRESSKCLTHEVSQSQINFIQGIRDTGGKGMGCILIGMKDVAVVMRDLQRNYTLKELREAPRISRKNGLWQLQDLFEIMKGFYDGK